MSVNLVSAPSLRRRGALLLIVLGTLSLFLLVGTVMLTLATRARQTSRAFAAATAGTAAGPMRARIQLEEALLRLIRGNPVGIGDSQAIPESLLGDMYGAATPLTGRMTDLTDNGTLIRGTIAIDGSGAEPPRAADLCGRILTFKPVAESSDPISSYRILRASGSGPYTCWLVSFSPDARAGLPQTPCPVVVNPPAFREEAYDGFDAENPWLTQLELEDGAVVAVPRPAFAAAGTQPEVDNDNDTVRDGVWLTDFLEPISTAGGGKLEFDVSYLVVDLDSRVNVNAHGSRTSIDYPAASGVWKNAPAVPLGSGYGPADVDASLLFVDPLGRNEAPSDPPVASDRWKRILGAAASGGIAATSSSLDQRRPAARVGVVQGRYGAAAAPGLPGINDVLSQRAEQVYGFNPLVDLKSMMKVDLDVSNRTSSAVPKMRFFSPAWSKSNPDWARVNYDDDPYEMRLDDDAPRPMELLVENAAQNDNPYVAAELEPVLRQFDADVQTLPPRLAVALDDFSQRSRLLVTTDSWDTPAMTGEVAGEVAAFIATLACDPAEVMSPDVLAGLRFDINRPFPTGAGEAAAKQDFCKHLYTLMVALGQPADATTAQWAANVVDYRDPDSRFTRFAFDTNLSDGWNPQDGDVVWGVERPELVIAQTLAWRIENLTDGSIDGGLYVSLYRPWAAEMIAPDGTVQSADVLDPALAKSSRAGETDVLDLAKKSGNDPIWRLRFDEQSKIVRFDIPGNSDKEITGVFRSKDAADLPPDSYLVVMPSAQKAGEAKKNGNSVAVSIDPELRQFQITQGGVFKADHWAGAGNDQPGSDTMVFLERLADPSLPLKEDPSSPSYNPYVVVDQLGIKIVNRSGVDPNNWRSFFRDPPFWRHRPFSKIVNPPELTVLDPNATNWLPWANRAYISHAELLLVPAGDALGMLSDYDIPKNKKAANPYYFLPTSKILEATTVASRFAGSQLSADPAMLAEVGLDKIPYNQISRWREPGRVNLNTVIPNRSCADPQRDDAVWWAVMGPDAAVSRDEYASAGPAKTLSEMLTLLQDPNIYIDTAADAGIKGNSWKKNRKYDLNPAAAYATAIRLANVATIRSHVFAVWITLRVRDTTPGAGDTYHRLFAIVDRSRPVGYAKGQNLNVRDTIRILRHLE